MQFLKDEPSHMEKGSIVRTGCFTKAMQGYLIEQMDDYIGINETICPEKLRQIKILPANSDKTIAQISVEPVFPSSQYFSGKFTQRVGATPSCYVQDRTLHNRPVVEENTIIKGNPSEGFPLSFSSYSFGTSIPKAEQISNKIHGLHGSPPSAFAACNWTM